MKSLNLNGIVTRYDCTILNIFVKVFSMSKNKLSIKKGNSSLKNVNVLSIYLHSGHP